MQEYWQNTPNSRTVEATEFDRTAIDRIGELGIVGAGGGGFPTAVKLNARVSTVIANAAECEPLLHKDKELLLHHCDPFLRGVQTAMAITGAREGVVGIKEKYHDIIAELEKNAPDGVRIVPLPDVYPAGDEFILRTAGGRKHAAHYAARA